MVTTGTNLPAADVIAEAERISAAARASKVPVKLVGGAAVNLHSRSAREAPRSEEHTSELQSLRHLVCRLLLEKKKKKGMLYENSRHTSDIKVYGTHNLDGRLRLMHC